MNEQQAYIIIDELRKLNKTLKDIASNQERVQNISIYPCTDNQSTEKLEGLSKQINKSINKLFDNLTFSSNQIR